MITEGMFERRATDPRGLAKGIRDLALTGFAYAAVILLLALAGVGPGMTPWLRIPAESYFLREALFTPVVMVLGGLLAAAVMQVIARALGGTGAFEDTLALTGLATAWGTLCTLVPDLVIALLLLSGVLEPRTWMHDITRPTLTLAVVWIYLLVYVLAFLLLFPAVARRVHDLRGWRSKLAGITAFVVYQVFLLVFIR